MVIYIYIYIFGQKVRSDSVLKTTPRPWYLVKVDTYGDILGNAHMARPRMNLSGNFAAPLRQRGISHRNTPTRGSGAAALDARGDC